MRHILQGEGTSLGDEVGTLGLQQGVRGGALRQSHPPGGLELV